MVLNIQNISKNLDDLDYKQMPHNIEAEQQLLGALLINNDLIDKISNFLKPDHFYENVHSVLFELILKLILSNKLASPITLKNLIDQDEVNFV